MMKRFSLSLMIVLTAIVNVLADQLTPEQALGRMKSSTPSKVKGTVGETKYTLTYSSKIESKSTYYVFNRNENSGFVVLSADDCMPAVLMETDENGAFDQNNMPDGLKWWLTQYDKAINRYIAEGKKYALSSNYDAILPLLGTTAWGQDSPYNDLCPEINETKVPTGCVATAMAQIMRYYQYPQKGNGCKNYDYYNEECNGYVPVYNDFSAHIYDWNNMLDSYNGDYTQEQGNSIAQLMYDCGVASETAYGSKASNADYFHAMEGLVDYFGYDASIQGHNRRFYSDEEWEGIIYHQLSKGQPIFYTGSDSIVGGHAFVCDGYKDGRYHMNWGWNGGLNCYVLLVPTETEKAIATELSEGEDGHFSFSSNQNIVLNILPNAGGEVCSDNIMGAYEYYTAKQELGFTSKRAFTLGVDPNIWVVGGFFNIFYKTQDLTVGIRLSNDNDTIYLESTRRELKPLYGYSCFSISIADIQKAGIYTVIPVYKDHTLGDTEWREMMLPSGFNSPQIIIKAPETSETESEDLIKGVEIDGLFYNLHKDSKRAGVAEWQNEQYSGDIVIPETIIHEGVTYTVTSIDKFAFVQCDNISSFSFPNTLDSIGEYSFYACRCLKSFTFTNKFKSIGRYAFDACYGLKSISIPTSITSIEEGAFMSCENMESIEIPNSILFIGSCAFSHCKKLKSINIPESTIEIAGSAFNGCENIESITVSPNNNYYDSRENCNAIISTINNEIAIGCSTTVFPNSIISIGEHAFAGSGITSIDIPKTITKINHFAFSGCKQLETVNLPYGLSFLGQEAFHYCSSLKSAYIPASVSFVGGQCFAHCDLHEAIWVNPDFKNYYTHIYSGQNFQGNPNLKEIKVEGEGMFASEDGVLFNNTPNYDIYGNAYEHKLVEYPCGKEGIYEVAEGMTIFQGAFRECEGLTSITLPNSLRRIEESMFKNCKNLKSVILGNTIESLGNDAFGECSLLTTLVCQTKNVPSIENSCFYNVDQSKCTLYVPDVAVDAYKSSAIWCDFGQILPLSLYDETDITSISTQSSEYIDAYGLTGSMIKSRIKASTVCESLSTGIYIINGKKVVITK